MCMSNKEIAKAIFDCATKYGFTVTVRGTTLTVHKSFSPGDNHAYVMAEGEAEEILDLLPQTSAGSTWGTDSGSVGGAIGLKGGYMTLNKSGGSKMVLKSLQNLQK